ncbi:hypothetical protein IFR05_011079 [Cadophora sp. M221]|nr:hypothetical protein IFR05_011079 [Cadophora sp. M221]
MMAQDGTIAAPLCCKKLRCRPRRRAIKLINGTKTVRLDWEEKIPKPPAEKGSPCVLSNANLANLPQAILYKIFKASSNKDSVSLGRSSKRLFIGLKDARPNLVYGVIGTSPKDSSANLGNLPYDLIYKIFQACSLTRAVAIGLSSKRLYGLLRLAHPDPIPLGYNEAPCFGDYDRNEDALSTMVGAWMPKHYRQSLTRIPEVPKHFVNMKVYGFMHSWKDEALWSHYVDWAAASIDGKMYYEKDFKSYLPHPYMKGQKWDREALEVIRHDTKRFASKVQWKKFWTRLPTHLTAYSFLFSNTNQYFSSQTTGSTPKGYTNTSTLSRLTHPEIQTLASNISTALTLKHGLKPGDVVSICSPNAIQYPAIMYGIMRAGGVPALSSPGFNEEEMMHIFKTVDCKLVFCPGEIAHVVRGALRRLSRNTGCIFEIDVEAGEGNLNGVKSLGGLIQEGRESSQVKAWVVPRGKNNSDVCALLCFSSGTTGLPKAVMISHQNIIAQCLQLIPTTSPDHKTVLGLLPFYHITGVVKMLVLPFVIGAEVVILPQFTMRGLLSTIEHYQIAEVQVVPPIIIRLVNDPIVKDYDLSCIKRFASGAAPISEEVLQLLEKKFPGRGFKQGYGMTESTGCITTHPLDKHAFKYARTGGTLVANTVVKVVDNNGELVGVGDQGEILAKGPQIFPGYLNNPVATMSTFDNESFLRTGDIGSINAEGCIVIHDRIKEMIKVKGVQVAPAELEDLLLGHEMVEDCAVIGVPDDYAGERPFGFVVLRHANGKDDGKEMGRVGELLMEYVKAKKGRGKWLVGVEFVESIPKSASGKILRRVLREEYSKAWAIRKAKL